MDLTTQLLITAAVIGSIALQLGRRTLSWYRLLGPMALVAGFAVYYLKTIPTAGADGAFTLAGVALGALLGSAAAVMVDVQKDASGRVITNAGLAYLALWVVTFAARMAFVQVATNSPETLHSLFVWAYEHGITQAGWTAFFMLQALVMVGVRTAMVAGRGWLLPQSSLAAEAEAA